MKNVDVFVARCYQTIPLKRLNCQTAPKRKEKKRNVTKTNDFCFQGNTDKECFRDVSSQCLISKQALRHFEVIRHELIIEIFKHHTYIIRVQTSKNKMS